FSHFHFFTLIRTPPPAAFCCDPLCMFGLGSGIGSFRDELSGLWMEWARRHHFAVWQSYVRSSAWAALNHEHGPEITQPREGGEDWRVSLDVKQFSPEEVTIQTNGDHLAISGIVLCSMFSSCFGDLVPRWVLFSESLCLVHFNVCLFLFVLCHMTCKVFPVLYLICCDQAV
uniref:Uncharacterized protein n=1 Tax=Erpetoichthys calabaricus TaxID=27687 RepID=A0A8C4TJJ9_ERPCA